MKIKNNDKKVVKKMLLEGKSVKSISSFFCVSVQTIYSIIKKNNWSYLLRRPKQEKNNKIKELIKSGKSYKFISNRLKVSKARIYENKRQQKNHKMTEWSEKKFLEIKSISRKYEQIFNLSGIYINLSDIESVLLDLLIHTDQKDISNKEAYFFKYAPLKLSNLKSRIIKRHPEQIIDDKGEEIYSFSLSPEEILLLKEKLNK